MDSNTRTAAARAFVRSLNILLKFARMYDFGHPRTAAQYETAWKELRTALGDNEAGLLLAASGDQLLLDGVALESAAAEKSFARLLSNAGIASIHFSPKVTQASLARFAKAFPAGGAKPDVLAEQLKAALAGDAGIHINEVCFVPADSAVAKGHVAATITAATLGASPEECNELFKDPKLLLQLIAAAEGSRAGSGGSGSGGGPGGGGSGGGASGPGGGGPGAGPGGGAFGPGGGGFGGGPGGSSAGGGPGGWSAYPGGPGAGVGGTAGVPGVPGAGASWPTSGRVGDEHSAVGAHTDGASGAFGQGTAPGGTGSSGNQTFPGAGEGIPASGGAGTAGSVGTGGSHPPNRWQTASLGLRGAGTRTDISGSTQTMVVETGLLTVEEDELRGILRMLAQFAGLKEGDKQIQSAAFQSRLSTLPRRAHFTLSQALATLAAQSPAEQSQEPLLLKLAEHIAIRYALESYERGDIKVNAVQETLEKMSEEIDHLRKIVGVHEDRMARAGLRVASRAEILAQQFWNEVGDDKKREALLSTEAWCIPPQNIRRFLEGLQKSGRPETIVEILQNYAAGIKHSNPNVRRATASGLAELATFYATGDQQLLVNTVREVGLQLSRESDSELQSLVSAAFVRLTQEATQRRVLPAVQKAVEMIEYVEGEHPALGRNLRPRIAVENRLPEFIDESLRLERVPSDLAALLRRIPQPAAEQLASRFSRCGFREDCDLLLEMMGRLGPEALDHLRGILRDGPASEAVDVVGMLSRLDLNSVEQTLPKRLNEWKRSAHDRAVRQLASSGSSERGRLLLSLFDSLDSLVRPLAVDEIGLSGEHSGDLRLVRLAEGDLPDDATQYLQLKAIEALGRLRTPGAELVLRRILEARQVWRWMYPSELRVVAAQAMSKIDPDYVKEFLPRSGLSVTDLSFEPLDVDPNSSLMRQRRYVRLRLDQPLEGTTTNLKENCHVEIPEMNLAGGVALSDQRMHPGAVVSLRLNPGARPVKAQAIVRDANTQARAFELVDMDLEERAKLRRLLVQLGNAMADASPEKRSRHRGRTLLSTPTT